MTADLELGLAIRRSLIGTPGPRREDRELLDGTAAFVADIRLPGLVDAAFVRSPYAHAAIDGIDLAAARSFPSVHLAVAAADLSDVQEFPQFLQFLKNVHLFPLARDRVRYVGAPVAVIVAGDRYVAEDACMEVVVDYRELPVVRSLDESLAPDATKLYEDWPDNKVLYFPHSSPEVAEAFEKYQSIKTTCRTQRQSANPIETRGVVADYRGGRLTVWSSTQAPHMLRSTLSFTLGLSEAQIRVIAPQVGGGFGAKLHQYPEEVLVAWLAKTLRRPVRWIEDRSEHMVSAVHARDQVMEVEAAFDDRGYVHALRCNLVTDVGSGEIFAPGTATSLVSAGVLTGPYKIPYSDVTITCAVTNKTPSGAYRGFGVPEAVFAMERTIERIAKQVNRDVNAVREMMLVKPEDLPYTIASGGILDSGSHLESFQRTVQLAEPLMAKARQRHSSNGRVRVGVGYSSYVEATAPTHFGTSGLWTAYDAASIKITPDGGAVVSVGVAATGQGTETMVATLAADALQIPLEKLNVAIGDTDLCPYGLGAWGSRSTVVMSGSIVKAAAKIFEKASTIAANMLEAAPADIVVEQGSYHVRGSATPAVTLGEIAMAAYGRTMALPEGVDPGLEATATFDPPDVTHFPDSHGKMNAASTWSNASHAAVVEVDVLTGVIRVVDYVVVHDCGTVINPTIVTGQIQGGVAQGIAGALYEHLCYSDEAQPQSASFMDYLIPTAIEIPEVTVDHFETPAPGIPLGAKGAGESGTIGTPAAVANAVANALAEFDVDVISMPITPEMVRDWVRDRLGPPWEMDTEASVTSS